jgi:DNA-directed RNA polymerase specialized sigma24 family protein
MARTDEQHDRETFAVLYPELRRFAAATADPDQDADDLLQEALARVLRRGGLSRLDDPAAYLKRAVVNLAANDRRSLGRRRRALQRVQVPEDLSPTYPSDLADLLSLSPEDRAVLWLTEVERLPSEQVAEVLGCSPEAARTRATRARRRLRRAFDAEEARS